MEIREYQTAQPNEVKSDLIRLNVSATATDTIPMLVALFVAALFGVSLSMLTYGFVLVASISFFDLWWRLRNAISQEINHVHKIKYGIIDDTIQENAELRQSLAEARRAQERAGLVVDSLARKNVEPGATVEVTKNFIPYDATGEHQQCIKDALLIFDTAMAGHGWRREDMTPGKMSQEQWAVAREWLVGAGILRYNNRKAAVWVETDRRVARGMLNLYSERVAD